MDLNTALENIKRTKEGYFASEEIYFLREHKEEAIPVLLERMNYVANNEELITENFEEHLDDNIYGLFLLAEFKVHEAFEPYIKLLQFDHQRLWWYMCDILDKEFCRIIGTVANHDDVDKIKSVIENEDLHIKHRICAANSLIVMRHSHENVYSKEELGDYFVYLFEKYEDNTELISNIVKNCSEKLTNEYAETVKRLFYNSKLNEEICDKEEFLQSIGYYATPENFMYHSITDKIPLHDTIMEMYWWPEFGVKDDEEFPLLPPEGGTQAMKTISLGRINQGTNPMKTVKFSFADFANVFAEPKKKKIKRNDPCPCGSGKKYKKCCLKTA